MILSLVLMISMLHFSIALLDPNVINPLELNNIQSQNDTHFFGLDFHPRFTFYTFLGWHHGS